MTPANSQPGRLALAVGGTILFAFGNLALWMVCTFAATAGAVGHIQEETVGLTAFFTGAAGGLFGAVAGFGVSFFGDRDRYLRRWAMLAAVSVVLAVIVNVGLLASTRSNTPTGLPAPAAGPAHP